MDLNSRIALFDNALSQYFNQILPDDQGLELISNSIKYSLFGEGKRFRPLLVMATADLLGVEHAHVLPLAMAIETIHTYSLIHDDLPCMDDDDYRRGKPTNHKKFGEDIALLAGDALISEALTILVKSYSHLESFSDLFIEFNNSIGAKGMIGGQVLDLRTVDPKIEQMQLIHKLKTGQLIKISVTGVGIIASTNKSVLDQLNLIGLSLGNAFQLKDDLHDSKSKKSVDEANMVNTIGVENVRTQLNGESLKLKKLLEEFDGDSASLTNLIDFNLNREV